MPQILNETQAREHIASLIFKQRIDKKSGTYYEVVNRFESGDGRVTGPIATEGEADELRDTMRGQKLAESAVRV